MRPIIKPHQSAAPSNFLNEQFSPLLIPGWGSVLWTEALAHTEEIKDRKVSTLLAYERPVVSIV